jgi:cysteine desulfurase/selenocysteine lyase
MSNVLGTVTPVGDIVQKAHAVGALVLLDGAQAVPHMPTDVQAFDCDFLAFSSHKMLGPTGSGCGPKNPGRYAPLFGGNVIKVL